MLENIFLEGTFLTQYLTFEKEMYVISKSKNITEETESNVKLLYLITDTAHNITMYLLCAENVFLISK